MLQKKGQFRCAFNLPPGVSQAVPHAYLCFQRSNILEALNDELDTIAPPSIAIKAISIKKEKYKMALTINYDHKSLVWMKE